MAKVYLKFNSAVIKEIDLKKDVITFGRKPDNDISIDNPAISGFHGKIFKEGDQYFVEDLNSTNGTFVNGQRIKKHTLKHKDQVGIARHVLEFVADGMPSDLQAPKPADPSLPPPAPTPDREEQLQALRRGLSMPGNGGEPAPAAPMPVEHVEEQGVEKKPAPTGTQGAVLKIISGSIDGQTEIKLKDLVTYIGSSDQALIKIKGFLAPSLAAAISKRPEGYFLKAVKPGYPKVNSLPISEQTLLENGALIEVGALNMIFYFSDAKKTS